MSVSVSKIIIVPTYVLSPPPQQVFQLVLLSASRYSNVIDKYTVAWHEWCSPVLSSLPNIHMENEKVSSDLWDVCLPARQNKLLYEDWCWKPGSPIHETFWFRLYPCCLFSLMPSDSSEITAVPDTTESDGWEEVWPAAYKLIFEAICFPSINWVYCMSIRKNVQLMRSLILYVNCFSYTMRLNGEQNNL